MTGVRNDVVAADSQQADSFLQSLFDKNRQHHPTRLEVLHRVKRLKRERQKAMNQRRSRRAQLVKLKRSLDETEANIARIEAELHDVENEWASSKTGIGTQLY